MRCLWFSFLRGIKNLIIWFPVIWEDQWRDDIFFFILIRKKLILMEKNFRKNGHHVGNEKDADKMRTCINLINRIYEDDYIEQAYKNHDKRWGQVEWSSSPTDNKYVRDIVRKYPNVKTKNDEKLQEKEAIRCSKLVEMQINQDIEMLFKILTKNIRSWWD
jgi:secreted Zn-dependent insulinase-like peptidase